MKRTYLDTVTEEINSAEEVWKNGEVNLRSFDLHSELNPEFWKNGKLDSETRAKLIEIAMDFFDTLDLSDITPEDDTNQSIFDKYIVDIQMLGSLASYNYSSYADVDLHLIMDEEAFTNGDELALNMLKKYLMKCKNSWNLLHNGLNIHGYDVELYVQDVHEKNAANGVYSLVNDEWVKKPERMSDKGLDRELVTKKVVGYIDQIDDIENKIKGSVHTEESQLKTIEERLNDIKTKIVKGRREALGSGKGEMCNENIIFKALRRTGHIGKINDLLSEIYDLRNSIDEE